MNASRQPATMTIQELGETLGISRGLAYELARTDSLPVPVIRFGRRMVVSRAAVERLLEQDKGTEGLGAVGALRGEKSV